MRRNRRTVFRDNAKWNLEFWGQMTGCLDFRIGKESWVMDEGPGICSLIFGLEHFKNKDNNKKYLYFNNVCSVISQNNPSKLKSEKKP